MSKAKREIGLRILEGIREIKWGEHGRVTNVPSVSTIREKTGLSQQQFARLLGSRSELSRSGSKGAVHLPVPPGHYCASQRRTLVPFLTLPEQHFGKEQARRAGTETK